MTALRVAVLVVAAASLLAACTTAPSPKPVIGPPNTAKWQQRHAKLKTLNQWQLRGEIAVVNGDQGHSGSLLWIENAPHFEVRVSGPFGIGSFRLHGTPNGLFIDTGDESHYTSDPARFLARRLGGPLPVNSLHYWVLGIPAPYSPAKVQVDHRGRLRILKQAGWTVKYERFETTKAGWTLPTYLKAQRGALTLKLAIQHWDIVADNMILD